MYEFTAGYVAGPISGEAFLPPTPPRGHVAVEYEDSGYMGGRYWAIVPSDWTIEAAARAFAAEGHLTTLNSVAGVGVPRELWDELFG
jgi:hypothetical protein